MEKLITALHLHLGCNVLNKDGVITRLDGLFIDWVLSNKIPQSEIPKLILRPLPSMTEEEAREFCIKEGWGENMENIVVTDGAINYKRVVIGNLTESCVSRFTRCRP